MASSPLDNWEYATVRVTGLGANSDNGHVYARAAGSLPFEDFEIAPTAFESTRSHVIWNTSEEVRVLDLMGSSGWELIGAPTVERQATSFGNETVTAESKYSYYFKRRARHESKPE